MLDSIFNTSQITFHKIPNSINYYLVLISTRYCTLFVPQVRQTTVNINKLLFVSGSNLFSFIC